VRFIPKGLRRIGAELSFNLPAEKVATVMAGRSSMTVQMPKTVVDQKSEEKTRGAATGPISSREFQHDYPSQGFRRMRSHVARLRAVGESRANLVVSSLDDLYNLLLFHERRRTCLVIFSRRSDQPKFEQTIVDYFRGRGMIALSDQLTTCDNIPNSLRTWKFCLPDNTEAIVELCTAVFRDIYNITEEQGLRFRGTGFVIET
jgi:hypothetical protein